MKVGDGNNASDPGELLERMREAHRQEEAGSVDETSSVDKASSVDRAGASSPAAGAALEGIGGVGSSDTVDGLEQRLLDTAASVLDGAFDSTDEVRRAVVEAIVTERYAETLGPAQT